MAAADVRPLVGIVVLSWNRRETITACLESVRRLEHADYDVVVVDNGSTDGSPEFIRQRFPEVAVIENGRNLGFAGGCNIGIERQMLRGARYVLLLNDDTEVAPDFLTALLDVAEADPAVGIVGSKIYYYDKPSLIWSAGGAVDGRGQARHLRVDEREDGTGEVPTDVDYVTGCAMLIKGEVIDRIGDLDERFFAYFEETEWCTRARRAGYRVVYAPRSRVWHKTKSTSTPASAEYLYLMARNRLLYLSCSGARVWTITAVALDLLRTAASWSLRPRYLEKRPFSRVLVRGVLDFMTKRFGPPPVGIRPA